MTRSDIGRGLLLSQSLVGDINGGDVWWKKCCRAVGPISMGNWLHAIIFGECRTKFSINCLEPANALKETIKSDYENEVLNAFR